MTEQDTTQTWLMSSFCFQNRYSQELALMYLWQEDYDRARHYTNMAHEFFLQVGYMYLISNLNCVASSDNIVKLFYRQF